MLPCDVFLYYLIFILFLSFSRHFLEIILTVINCNDAEKFRVLFIAHLFTTDICRRKDKNKYKSKYFFNRYSYLDRPNHCDAEYEQIPIRAQARK